VEVAMKPEIVPELRPLIERAEAAYQRFYEGVLRETLERTAWGKYVAIHLDTGDHILADTEDEVAARFRDRFPDAMPYTLRIGIPRLIA
jgi:hypothetical protein